MSEQQKKIYVGNGKRIGQTGIKIGINLSKIAKEGAEFIKDSNGNKWINLTIWENQNGEDQYKNTHSVQIDTWKPSEQSAASAPAPVASTPVDQSKTFTNNPNDINLPF